MLSLEQKQTIYYFMGKIYVPKELRKSSGELLLHLSDTTQSSIKPLRHLIAVLKPQYIIHTGNLTADIKSLDLSRAASSYEISLRKTMALFANAKAQEVYIALGGKDYEPSVRAANYGKAQIIPGVSEITLCNRKIVFGHRFEEIRQIPGDIHLFGEKDLKGIGSQHSEEASRNCDVTFSKMIGEENLSSEGEQLDFFSLEEARCLKSQDPLAKGDKEPVFLNGQEHIHAIHLPTMTVYRLLYPLGSHSQRVKQDTVIVRSVKARR